MGNDSWRDFFDILEREWTAVEFGTQFPPGPFGTENSVTLQAFIGDCLISHQDFCIDNKTAGLNLVSMLYWLAESDLEKSVSLLEEFSKHPISDVAEAAVSALLSLRSRDPLGELLSELESVRRSVGLGERSAGIPRG